MQTVFYYILRLFFVYYFVAKMCVYKNGSLNIKNIYIKTQ